MRAKQAVIGVSGVFQENLSIQVPSQRDLTRHPKRRFQFREKCLRKLYVCRQLAHIEHFDGKEQVGSETYDFEIRRIMPKARNAQPKMDGVVRIAEPVIPNRNAMKTAIRG